MNAYTIPILAAFQSRADDGLSVGEILGSIPTDPVTVFTILLLASCLVLVLWAGRRKGDGGDGA
jgi:hypothetical protein